MSVIELEKSEKHIPDPYAIVLEEPDPRLERLRQDIQKLRVDADLLAEHCDDADFTVKKQVRAAENSITRLINVHDESKKLWTILGTALFCLTTLNLIRASTRLWKWYGGRKSDPGYEQEHKSVRPRLQRKHPRNWVVSN